MKSIGLRIIQPILFLLMVNPSFAQDTITVIFLHGSKPASGQTNEYKTVGGIRGGHIVTKVGDNVYGFNYKSKHIHVFPHHNTHGAIMEKEKAGDYLKYKNGIKLTYINIPVSHEDFLRIQNYYEENVVKAKFDYAFFGMRCASTCYQSLSMVGVFKPAGRLKSVYRAFGPVSLKKKLTKKASKNNYDVQIIPGRKERIWEGN